MNIGSLYYCVSGPETVKVLVYGKFVSAANLESFFFPAIQITSF